MPHTPFWRLAVRFGQLASLQVAGSLRPPQASHRPSSRRCCRAMTASALYAANTLAAMTACASRRFSHHRAAKLARLILTVYREGHLPQKPGLRFDLESRAVCQ